MPIRMDKYDVIELLGEGAKSKIYLVRDPSNRQLYALKHVKREKPKDIRFIEQMETEHQIGRQFNHPNLRKSIDLKLVRSWYFQVSEAFGVLELVDGKALDIRPPQGTLNIVNTFIQAAEGLKAMHALGFAHCDLKPNNILRDDRGHVTLIDFGQSCPLGTVKERIQGTPDFIAPEQVARKPIAVQTDVFNLGATLYWCLTGRHIPTLYTVNKKGENSFLLDTRINTPQDINHSCPVPLSNLVMECIATNMRKRPETMEQMITRLELVKHILLKQLDPGSVQPPPVDDMSLNDSRL